MKDLNQYQQEVHEWATRNFGSNPSYHHPLMGVVEEIGELHHALLKQEQGIRGTWQENEVKAKDAVGDLMVYLFNLCQLRGWSLSEILNETWEQVRLRDWTKNKDTGLSPGM